MSTLPSSSADAILLDAVGHHRAGRIADAVRGYQAAMPLFANSANIGYLLALAWLEMGNTAAARPLLDVILEALPQQAFLHSSRALAQVMEGEADAAVGFSRMMALRSEPLDDTPALRDALIHWHQRIVHCRQFHSMAAEVGQLRMGGYEHQPVDGVCPVCRGRQVRRLFSVTATQAAQHFQRIENDGALFTALRDRIAGLWGGAVCSILRCDVCGFGFADPFVAGDAVFYNVAFPYTDYPDSKWEFTATRNALAGMRGAFGDEGMTILEIGAGKGAFLDTLVPALARPDRLAFTEYASDRRAELVAAGYTAVDPDTVRRPALADRERFDAVCAFQVIEHCDGLDELFSGLNTLLRPGGSVFLAVPNPDFTEFTECNGGLIDMPPNHIGRWTPAALAIMGHRQGWSMVACQVDPTETVVERRRRFHSFRYMREAQIPGRLAQAIDTCTVPRLRLHLMTQMALFYDSFLDLGDGALTGPAMGTGLWAHFAKPRSGTPGASG